MINTILYLYVKRQNILGPLLITRTIIRMCCVIMLAGCCVAAGARVAAWLLALTIT